MNHNKIDNLRVLGAWIVRKYKACNKRMKEAKVVLAKNNYANQVLCEEWAAQVHAQTAKLDREVNVFLKNLY